MSDINKHKDTKLSSCITNDPQSLNNSAGKY